jgi:hypothetical protein
VFVRGDWELLCELASAVQRLDEEQIRLLGTHSTSDQTKHAVRFELDHWDARCSACLSCLSSSRWVEATHLAQDALEYAEEAMKKGVTNERQYDCARSAFSGADLGDCLRSAFEACSHPAQRIWTSDLVPELLQESLKIPVDFCTYLVGVTGICSSHPQDSSLPRQIQSGTEAAESLNRRLAQWRAALPSFQSWAQQESRERCSRELATVFDMLKGKMHERPEKGRCKQGYLGYMGLFVGGYENNAW